MKQSHSPVKQSGILMIFVGLLISFSVMIFPAEAKDIGYLGFESSILDSQTVQTEMNVIFNENVREFQYALYYNIYNITAESTFDLADCQVKDSGEQSVIYCKLYGVSETDNRLKLNFYSNNVGEIDNAYKFSPSYDFSGSQSYFVVIKLPPKSFLSGDPAEAIFPRNGKLISDGKKIIAYWENQSITEDIGNLDFFVLYEFSESPENADYSYLFILVPVVIVMLLIVIYVLLRKQKGKNEEILTSVLNKDEKRVVDILKSHEGKALQKVIVREGNFSKAKVSRLVNDMKSRNIVNVEAVSGRENRVLLNLGGQKQEKPAETKSEPEAPKDSGQGEQGQT